jgi:hypothetical protein
VVVVAVILERREQEALVVVGLVLIMLARRVLAIRVVEVVEDGIAPAPAVQGLL